MYPKWKSFSHVWLLLTPWTIQSLEFSRPEFWSGSHSLLQGIFPTQGLNPGLPHCRRILYQLSHQGSPSHVSKSMKKVWILLFCVSFSVYTSQDWLLPTLPSPPLLIICVPHLVFIITFYMIRNFFLSLFFFFFWPHYKSCRILVPQTGTEPVHPAVEAQRLPLDHQESPRNFCLYFNNTAP